MEPNQEAVVRLGSFLFVLAVMSITESLLPRRKRVANRPKRAGNNLLLATLNSITLRLLPILSAVAAADWARGHQLGLLPWLSEQFGVAIPFTIEILVAVLFLDWVIYTQHVLAHRVPLFWRFHRVHHADLDLDATSGLRFHTVEIVASMAVKCAAAILLGASPLAIVIFEVVLNATSIFNHSNVALSNRFDHVLRIFLVTPDMHRVHHSIERDETDSNFGFNVPWWDWMFRTYRAQPRSQHTTMPLGLPEIREESEATPLLRMLRLPFIRNSRQRA